MIRPLYKAQAPFMEVPVGHGYLGVVMYDDVEDKVQCHVCGGWFRSVGGHASRAHKIQRDDYKMQYGLTLRTALCSREISRKHSIVSLRPENKLRFSKCAIRPDAKKRRLPKLNGAKTVMFRNRSGFCDLQIRTRYEVIKQMCGHEPAIKDLMRFDPPLYGAIKRYHGNINGYRRHLGLREQKRGLPRRDDLHFVAELRKFAKETGERPKTTTFGKTTEIYRRFGSWSNALRTAGLK